MLFSQFHLKPIQEVPQRHPVESYGDVRAKSQHQQLCFQTRNTTWMMLIIQAHQVYLIVSFTHTKCNITLNPSLWIHRLRQHSNERFSSYSPSIRLNILTKMAARERVISKYNNTWLNSVYSISYLGNPKKDALDPVYLWQMFLCLYVFYKT